MCDWSMQTEENVDSLYLKLKLFNFQIHLFNCSICYKKKETPFSLALPAGTRTFSEQQNLPLIIALFQSNAG